MKRRVLYAISILLLSSLVEYQLPAQAPQNCYANYKNAGDSLKKRGDNAGAKKQYQLARSCTYITTAQKREIDGLIAAIR